MLDPKTNRARESWKAIVCIILAMGGTAVAIFNTLICMMIMNRDR